MSEFAIRVENVSKVYKLYDNPLDRLKESLHPFRKKYHRDFYALGDIDLEVIKGESLGIIGKNGSGKSTLLKVLAGVLTPTSGTVMVNGKVASLLELGAGFNFEMTGIENVYFNGTVMGFSKQEMDAKIDDILSFADIGSFVHQPVKTYSSGMFVRLAFASAVSVQPEIMIIDEALAVGDAEFQTRCFVRMNKLKATGTTILLVSHNIATIRSFCDRALYLDAGRSRGYGDVIEITDLYERDILKRSHASVHCGEGNSTLISLLETSHSLSSAGEPTILMTLHREQLSFNERAKGDRRGTGRISFLSFLLLNEKGMPVGVVDPTETIKACFLLQAREAMSSEIHIGLIVKDKCGSPVAVIRDSKFDGTQKFDVDESMIGEMTFSLPLQADTYYMQIGILLFRPGTKYEGGTFNFLDAEISDLVEFGAHFEVAPWRKHPIPVAILIESDLTLSRSEITAP